MYYIGSPDSEAKAVLTILSDERHTAIISLGKDFYPSELANQAIFAKTFLKATDAFKTSEI